MRLAVVALCVIVVGDAAARQSTPIAERADAGWNQEAAAAYLDDRMDAWFANAKKLRTGPAQTSCASCHTSLPYVLSRPALRNAMGVKLATAHEMRIVDEAAQRVETFGTHQLFYENTDAKKAESRGTEAVLNALILASAKNPAAPRAFMRLWETQRADGTWDWLNFGLEPFETVDAVYHGATLAALAVGLNGGAGAPGVDKLRQYLKGHYSSQRLFNRIWMLLASSRLAGLLATSERRALIAEIEARQRPDGGWSLDSLGAWRWNKTETPFAAPGQTDAFMLAQSDGYATGLVVYALRTVGLSADRPAVAKGLQWLRSNQSRFEVDRKTWMAWRTHSLNFDREHGGDKGEPWRRLFMSDAATAFAVLALTAAAQ